MRRLVLVVATWAVGTLLAVTLAWWAVGRVSSEVVDRPAAPLSDREVALALGVEAAGTTAPTTPSVAAAPATAVPGAATATAPSATAPAATAPAGGPSTVATTPTTVPGATVHAPSPPPPSTSTPGATAPPPGVTTTIDSVGGQVAVRYAAGGVDLVWARPKTGFQAEVHDAGPEDVEVRFVSDDHESRIRAFYSNGVPDREVREEADGEDDHEGRG